VVTDPVSSGKQTQQMIGTSMPKGGMHTFLQDVLVKKREVIYIEQSIAIWNLKMPKCGSSYIISM